MCDNVWADVCCIRYVEHFSDLFCHVRRKLKKMNTVYLWVAIILTGNHTFLHSQAEQETMEMPHRRQHRLEQQRKR